MKPTYTLHKLPEGFIVTSDEGSEKGELTIFPDTQNGKIVKLKSPVIAEYDYASNGIYNLKVIVQQNQIGFSDNIPEEKLREIGWFDWVKIAILSKVDQMKKIGQKCHSPSWYKGFKFGFQKAQELLSDRRFTEEDMLEIAGYMTAANKHLSIEVLKEVALNHIQSISQKSWDVELEMEQEMVCENVFNGNSVNKGWVNKGLKPKLTNGKVTITKIL